MIKTLVGYWIIVCITSFLLAAPQGEGYRTYKSHLLNIRQPPQVPFPYRVVVQTHPTALGDIDDIDYVLLTDSNREVVRIDCSYVPEGENDDWALSTALKTDVHCSPDGKHIALDEGNSLDVGTVFLIDLTDRSHPKVRQLGGPDLEKFFPGQRLSDFHFGITEDKGWIDNDHISIEFKVSVDIADNQTKNYQATALATYEGGRLDLQLESNN